MLNNNNNNNVFGFNNNMNNFNIPLQNNIYPINNIFFQLALAFVDDKGWTVYNKDGNIVNNFNSFELYKFLIENIVANNIKLDDYIIGNQKSDQKFHGGLLYVYLTNTLEYVYQYIGEQYLRKQMELKSQITVANNLNNNLGTGNLFPNNNNNFNLNLNNLNNNMNVNNNQYLYNK